MSDAQVEYLAHIHLADRLFAKGQTVSKKAHRQWWEKLGEIEKRLTKKEQREVMDAVR